jgi:hypothetical protein
MFFLFVSNLLFNVCFSVRALAKNSSFGFSALAFVSAKTKCAICAVGSFQLAGNG